MTEQQLTRQARRRLAILRHADEVTGNVEPFLASPVVLVVGFGGDEVGQLLENNVSPDEHDAVCRRGRPEDQPFAGRIDKRETSQRRSHLRGHDDAYGFCLITDRAGSAQVVRRSLPPADHAFVAARRASPPDRGGHVAAEETEQPRTRPPARATTARQRARPGHPTVTGRGSSHDERKVLGHPPSRTGCVDWQVNEVAEIRNDHAARRYVTRVMPAPPSHDVRLPHPIPPSRNILIRRQSDATERHSSGSVAKVARRASADRQFGCVDRGAPALRADSSLLARNSAAGRDDPKAQG